MFKQTGYIQKFHFGAEKFPFGIRNCSVLTYSRCHCPNCDTQKSLCIYEGCWIPMNLVEPVYSNYPLPTTPSCPWHLWTSLFLVLCYLVTIYFYILNVLGASVLSALPVYHLLRLHRSTTFSLNSKKEPTHLRVLPRCCI